MSGRNNLGWILAGGAALVMLTGCVLGFLLFGGLLFGGVYYPWGPGMMSGIVSWRGIGMALFGLVIVAGIILAVTGNLPHWFRREDDAYGIARERYARGEITKEEYDKILESLKIEG